MKPPHPSMHRLLRPHTQPPRHITGPAKRLRVDQTGVLTTAATVARTAAAAALAMYKNLPNYRNNWLRLGFTEDEIEANDSRFVDGVVAWGTADQIRTRMQEHTDAGADHVCIQALNPESPFAPDMAALEALAP